MKFVKSALLSLMMVGLASAARPGCLDEDFEAHVKKVSDKWEDPEVLITIGQTCNGYTPPGIPDGMGGYRFGNIVRIFVNHELRSNAGSPYDIPTANEGAINGGRVSFLDIDAETRKLVDAGLAYKLIRARNGDIVRSSDDLDFSGISRLCSAQFFERGGSYGLENDIFFTGEETSSAPGGTEFALNAVNGHMHAVPWMGRAAWESVTMFDQPDDEHVAILVGDDRGGAPLLLYVGEKQPGNFLERNGLAFGHLYVWVADDEGLENAEDFLGAGNYATGKFKKIEHYKPDMAGQSGECGSYDELGFADLDEQDCLAFEGVGAFKFSRPEDVSTNPDNGLQAVLHSTGRPSLFPNEKWGQNLLIDVDFANFVPGDDIPATITIAYDGNEFESDGIRSPDNGVWASDGFIYIQEDRAVGSSGGFCGDPVEETSIWRLDPNFPSTGDAERIYQVNRDAMLPPGQEDIDPDDCGDWETSGIIDVTDLFDNHGCNPLLLANAQSHSVRGEDDPNDDLIVNGLNLEQGGQVFFLCKK